MIALLLLACAAAPIAQEPLAEQTVGLEGRVEIRFQGDELLVRPNESGARILVRIADQGVLVDGGRYATLLFLARAAGDYDLREQLLFAPGRPLGPEIEAIPVRVLSVLPADHQGDLDPLDTLEQRIFGGFRNILVVVLLLWLVPPALWLVWRWRHRPRPEPVVVEVVPTLADQLRPLVEAALAGQLEVEAQARLERLLLAHWREQLGLDGLPAAQALQRMRRHAEAGRLLTAVERWLHAPSGTTHDDAEVSAVLQPYASTPALPAEQIAASGTTSSPGAG